MLPLRCRTWTVLPSDCNESDGKSGIESGGESGIESGGKSGDGAIVSKRDGGISVVGSGGTEAAAWDKGGFGQTLRFTFGRIYNYLTTIDFWNAALALLLLGYYGKYQFWGSNGRCPPKKKAEPPPPCSACCKCFEQPRILRHRLKWPEDPKPTDT